MQWNKPWPIHGQYSTHKKQADVDKPRMHQWLHSAGLKFEI